MKIERAYLLAKKTSTSAGSLNRKADPTLLEMIADARVNQMGAQRQMTVFGKVYADARIVRVMGEHAADSIGLSGMSLKTFAPSYAITKVAYHQYRTDFYIIVDKKQVGGD
ncbi:MULTISPECIES: hypothetical protein [Lactiplantibacillus]|uniref:hypothetical protein n=1 Tax=Lactiplantibacillus TaxID=2767842 RepID=UPI0009331E8D|nr:hypothetical protein [Lactiplantibacillus plantarum]KAB1953808.1 hypothetical protein F8276_11770 [Lactiplantibacillus plantarum]MEC5117820.1 hypothetical protein [Lactiplantibacillus plantarum]UZM81915.1 hypothetical protein OP869_10070 [Lactiplantibacillus argentoratensis]